MSLTRDHNDIVFECDACHSVLETKTSDFGEAMGALRRANWQSLPRLKRKPPEWEHHCAGCKVEQRKMV